jgi:hypothetical protein
MSNKRAKTYDSAVWGGFKSEMEKIAIDPLTMMLAGAGSHLVGNVATKAFHKQLGGVRAKNFAGALRDTIAGKPRGALSNIGEMWAGPEHVVAGETGRELGDMLRDVPASKRFKILKKLRKRVAMTPGMKHTPVMEDMVPGINKALKERLPNKGVMGKETLLAKAAPYALAPAIGWAEPGMLAHAAVNKSRSLIARSGLGKRFMKEQAAAGAAETPGGRKILGSVKDLGKKVKERVQGPIGNILSSMTDRLVNSSEAGQIAKNVGKTKPLSKLHQKASDVFLSPAAYDSRKIGRKFGDMLGGPVGTQRVNKIVGSMQPVIRKRYPELAEYYKNKGREAIEKATALAKSVPGVLEKNLPAAKPAVHGAVRDLTTAARGMPRKVTAISPETPVV